MNRVSLTAKVVLVGLLLSGSASAQESGPAEEGRTKDGRSYIFKDDPMTAGGLDPNMPTIRIVAKASRTTLIRPRVSFVAELLKSVENL